MPRLAIQTHKQTPTTAYVSPNVAYLGVIHTRTGHHRIRHPNFHPSPTLNGVTPLYFQRYKLQDVTFTKTNTDVETNPCTFWLWICIPVNRRVNLNAHCCHPSSITTCISRHPTCCPHFLRGLLAQGVASQSQPRLMPTWSDVTEGI